MERADDPQFHGLISTAIAFLRQWPDGTPAAIAIHLRRAGFSQVPEPGPREAVAWKVFAFTLAELDRLDREEAERQARTAAAAARRPQAARREELALMPGEDNPLSDLGRAVERRG
jgi:hypothetical protein